MLIINGIKFYEEPGTCGTCPFLFTGKTNTPMLTSKDRGVCIQWNEKHHTWATVPKRCRKLFKKAFNGKYPDGMELVIVNNK